MIVGELKEILNDIPDSAEIKVDVQNDSGELVGISNTVYLHISESAKQQPDFLTLYIRQK